MVGQVHIYGGPANPKTGRMALNGQAEADWQVIVLSGTTAIAKTTSNSRGYYSVWLLPGAYHLWCSGAPVVVILPGQQTRVDCRADVP